MAKKSNVWNRIVALKLCGSMVPGGLRIPHSFASFKKMKREDRSKALRHIKSIESRRKAVLAH